MRRRIHQVRPEIAVTRARQRRQVPHSGRSADKVDESLQETFPASDLPSWTLSAPVGRQDASAKPQRRNHSRCTNGVRDFA
jgi:hypothetical protein